MKVVIMYGGGNFLKESKIKWSVNKLLSTLVKNTFRFTELNDFVLIQSNTIMLQYNYNFYIKV